MTRRSMSGAAVLAACTVLCGMAPPDPEKDLERALKSNNQAAVVDALEAMRDAPPTKDHVKTILKVVPVVTTRDAYLAAVDALAAAQGDAREEVAKGVKAGKAPAVRVACVDALARVREESSVTALREALDDREGPVRVAAIRGLSKLELKASIPALYERLFALQDRSGGNEVDELYRALHHLTGQSLETLEDWKKYYETLPADFDPSKRGAAAGEGPTTRTREGAGKIFDSEVTSRAFVLVLDISSSMRVIDLPPGEKWKDKDGKDHNFRDPGMGAPHNDSRFRRAQREFTQFIESLRPEIKFAIVVYGDRARAWREDLVPATEGNKKAAVQFVNGVTWEPATVTDKALEAAFAIPGIDTIYLFSDGIPEKRVNNKNEDIPQDEVIARAQELNLTRKLRINCYGFATASDSVRGFLRRLAEANEGEYKDIR